MKLYILYTGGTIGSLGDPLAPMPFSKFSNAFVTYLYPMIKERFPHINLVIDGFTSTIDSTNMQPSEWVLMAKRIVENYNSYDAFLILHGTDTMAWTSSSLSFMLPGISKPLTVTGSQLPLFVNSMSKDCGYQVRYNTDAVRNVLGSIEFLTMNIPEVCLFFGDNLFRGNRVVKSNTSDFVAFTSPNYHVLGRYGIRASVYSEYVMNVPAAMSLSHPANLEACARLLDTMQENIAARSVLQLQTFPGYYNRINGISQSQSLFASVLQQLQGIQPPLGGVILESYGVGNIPSFPCVQNQVDEMHKSGIILIDCTQVFAGAVDYDEYEAGSWLRNKGVIGGRDITSIAAMAKLSVLLAQHPNASQEEIEYRMTENIAGEMNSKCSVSKQYKEYEQNGIAISSVEYKCHSNLVPATECSS